MRKLRLLAFFLIALAFVLALTACEGKTTYYTVTFDSNGGSTVHNRAIETGNTFTAPEAPTRTGYTFVGWYNGETVWNFETDVVNSNVTLTAKWERLYRTVTFNSDGGTAIESQMVYDGMLVEKPQPPKRENFLFLGWYNGNTAWDFYTDPVLTDLTLTAKWEDVSTYTVSFNSDGGTNVAEQYIIAGGKVNEPQAPTKAGAVFDGWYNGDAKWNFDTDNVSSNITLTAKW